jgi:hypothetical protein
MKKKEIKNSRNPESDSYLLDIQMHNTIESSIADELAKDIASYIMEREKVESCTIHFLGPRKGEVSFLIDNNGTRRLLDFDWDNNQVTQATLLYKDGTDYRLNVQELDRVNKEIYQVPGSFIESSMDIVTLNFVEHLIKTN